MKKIEDLFKSALKDQELPYNENAWNEMSKRLDARGGSAGHLKWILGAAVVGVLTIGTLIYLSNGKTDIKNSENLKMLSKNSSDKSFSPSEEKSDAFKTTNTSETDKVEKIKSSSPKRTAIENKASVPSVEKCCEDEKIEVLVPPVYREPLIEKEETENNTPLDVPTVTSPTEVSSIKWDMLIRNHCLNEEWSWFNKNDASIWLQRPKNDLLEIPAMSTHREILSEKGIYQLGLVNKENNFESHARFTVFEADVSEVQMISDDALNYEKGLPELKVEAYIDGKNTWYLDGEIQARDQSTHSYHLFKKGIHTMNVETTDANGCHASSSVTFNVEGDYNLLAVNAFSPTSMEPKNTRFIPFALTQRDTPFKMIVIDPSDGATLFETSSFDMPWDGTNRNTGKMVDAGKSYVWKVILEQPEDNENPEYIGTVVRL
jgi:hypothetical protein